MDRKRSFESNFLTRVLSDQMGTDFNHTKLVFLAIHAVFLESGLVGFDSLSQLRADYFDILKEQSSMSFTTTVSYTLPELLSSNNGTDSIVLKLQTLGHYVNAYASLASSPLELHKLSIDRSRFAPPIGNFWVTFDRFDRLNDDFAEKVVLELWKIVKDGLVMPLLIDLCEKTGLTLPPCWTRLPEDIKIQILPKIRGLGLARIACVCKELRELSSNNELWEKKFKARYGGRSGILPGEGLERGQAGYWKKRYGLMVQMDNKKRKMVLAITLARRSRTR